MIFALLFFTFWQLTGMLIKRKVGLKIFILYSLFVVCRKPLTSASLVKTIHTLLALPLNVRCFFILRILKVTLLIVCDYTHTPS